MFKIGEFSRLSHVSVRMLRYYDEMGLLKPAVVDGQNGYRLYSADQIEQLQRIVFLRDLEFSVAEISSALGKWKKNYISRLLESKKNELETALREKQGRIDKINVALGDIAARRMKVHCNVSIKSIPSFTILARRRCIPSYFHESELWAELGEFVHANGINVLAGAETMTFFHDEEHQDGGVDVEVACQVSGLQSDRDGFTWRLTEPVETAASVMVTGRFENIDPVYQSFGLWLEEHGQYSMYGVVRQVCHRGPFNEANPDLWLTELQIPIRKIS